MNYQEFVDVVVTECVEFADYLGYLPVDEFGEEEVLDSLESSDNVFAKEALKFYKRLSVEKAEILMEKVFNKLENGVEAAPVVVARPVIVRPPVVASKPIVVKPIGKVEQKSVTATSKPAYVPFVSGSGLVKNDDGKKPASSVLVTQSFLLPDDFFVCCLVNIYSDVFGFAK